MDNNIWLKLKYNDINDKVCFQGCVGDFISYLYLYIQLFIDQSKRYNFEYCLDLFLIIIKIKLFEYVILICIFIM